jgi:DNA end-binding protein Ku
MLQAKQAGEPLRAAKPAAKPSNVVNLMDALRKSVAAEGTAPARTSRGRKAPARAEAAPKRRKLRKAG